MITPILNYRGNKILETLDEQMGNAQAGLKRAMAGLRDISNQGGMVYLIIY